MIYCGFRIALLAFGPWVMLGDKKVHVDALFLKLLGTSSQKRDPKALFIIFNEWVKVLIYQKYIIYSIYIYRLKFFT